MADDVLVLLEYIGWNKDNVRDLHFIGASMGGMICQGKNRNILNFFKVVLNI
jgi:hypothetical protein